jgi:hypothetical protein
MPRGSSQRATLVHLWETATLLDASRVSLPTSRITPPLAPGADVTLATPHVAAMTTPKSSTAAAYALADADRRIGPATIPVAVAQQLSAAARQATAGESGSGSTRPEPSYIQRTSNPTVRKSPELAAPSACADRVPQLSFRALFADTAAQPPEGAALITPSPRNPPPPTLSSGRTGERERACAKLRAEDPLLRADMMHLCTMLSEPGAQVSGVPAWRALRVGILQTDRQLMYTSSSRPFWIWRALHPCN